MEKKQEVNRWGVALYDVSAPHFYWQHQTSRWQGSVRKQTLEQTRDDDLNEAK